MQITKDKVLSSFSKRINDEKRLKNLVQKYPLYFTRASNMPENFRNPEQMSHFNSQKSQEMGEKLSFYSALSRLTIDQSLFDDVLANPSNHNPFTSVEEEKEERYKWYYTQPNGELFGPLSGIDMDKRYQLGVLKKGSKVKTREDDSYYHLINLLKRYSKILKTRKLQLPEQPKLLSNKIKKFRKGVVVRGSKPTSNLGFGEFGKGEPDFDFSNGQPIRRFGRAERTRTYAPRPVFQLKQIKEKGNTDDIPPPTRERAKTQV